jgi:hypothetical protein
VERKTLQHVSILWYYLQANYVIMRTISDKN